MTGLIEAADCAYPFDYSILPDSVSVILGYVGEHGNTPHVWSTQDVAAARATGRLWCPIWVTPQRALTTADGVHAASGMAYVLPQYQHPVTEPVFLDIEYGSYHADPNGARAAVTAWQNGMAHFGWRTAIAYLPEDANAGWVADWTGHMPATLPTGWRGQQFAGNVDRGRYDLSVFEPTVFNQSNGAIDMSLFDGHTLTTDEQAQLDRLGQFVAQQTRAGVRNFFLDPREVNSDSTPKTDPATGKPYGAHSILTLCERAATAALKATPVEAGSVSVDVKALAQALASELTFTVTASAGHQVTPGAHAATT